MKETLYEEILNTVLARIKARDMPKSFWKEVAKEVAEETPTHPALERWMHAQIDRSLATKGMVNVPELAELALGDELLERRTGEEAWKKIKRRVIDKLVDEELARGIADGSVVEVAMESGEIGYQRKEEA